MFKTLKTPIKIILNRVLGLSDQVASSNAESSIILRDELFDFLKECGWSNEEFDFELLKIIDGSWDYHVN